MNPPLTAQALAECFDRAPAGTIGIEEEVMLLDPDTLGLAARAPELLTRLHGDPRFKLELPAAQLEIVLGPFANVRDVVSALAEARAELAAAAEGLVRPAAAGVHPFSSGVAQLNRGERYDSILAEYGGVARRQLVHALQVHVAVGGAVRTLAVYNGLRSYLPLLAALAANAPFYEREDCGLASVRPLLAALLPRQGVPPRLESWEQYAQALAWGERAGRFSARTWWWELRPHPAFGTLELRVPDAQTTVADAGAVALVIQSLAHDLAARYDAGERVSAAPRWRIEENRWSACRHGASGMMADLNTGEPRPTAALLNELLDTVEPTARHLGCGALLARARELAVQSPAGSIRQVAASSGVHEATRWLAERFSEAVDG